jgi:hypothetical protein
LLNRSSLTRARDVKVTIKETLLITLHGMARNCTHVMQMKNGMAMQLSKSKYRKSTETTLTFPQQILMIIDPSSTDSNDKPLYILALRKMVSSARNGDRHVLLYPIVLPGNHALACRVNTRKEWKVVLREPVCRDRYFFHHSVDISQFQFPNQQNRQYRFYLSFFRFRFLYCLYHHHHWLQISAALTD